MADHLPGGDAGHPEPGPDARAARGLIICAERALLGAVMSDPARQAWLLGFVLPSDMVRPYHGQVLATMRRLIARKHPHRDAQAAEPLDGETQLRM